MTFFSKLVKHYELKARAEVYEHLRAMPERRLHALGYSPRLLNQGIKGWPWKEGEAAAAVMPLAASQQAVNESVMSDNAATGKTVLAETLHAA